MATLKKNIEYKVGMDVKLVEKKEVVAILRVTAVKRSGEHKQLEVDVVDLSTPGLAAEFVFLGEGNPTKQAKWKMLFRDPFVEEVRCYGKNAPNYSLQPA